MNLALYTTVSFEKHGLKYTTHTSTALNIQTPCAKVVLLQNIRSEYTFARACGWDCFAHLAEAQQVRTTVLPHSAPDG